MAVAMTAPWRLDVAILHPGFGHVGLVDPYSKLTAVLRESEVGTWELKCRFNGRNRPLMVPGVRILVRDRGKIIFSGPMTRAKITRNVSKPLGELEISGITDEHILADRIVLPDPTRAFDQQTTLTHSGLSGVAATVLEHHALSQAGGGALYIPASLIDRRSNLIIAPTVPGEPRGAFVTSKGRYDNLIEFMQGIALAGGVAFRVKARDDGTPMLRVYVTRDLSREVIISPRMNNLEEGTWWTSAPKTNAVVTASQGELTERYVYEQHDFNSQMQWGRRIETLRDQRSQPDVAQVQKDTATALEEGRETAAVKFIARETDKLRYGIDYELGDTITCSLIDSDGVYPAAEVAQRITEVKVEQGLYRPKYTPIVGVGEDATDSPADVGVVRRLIRDVRSLKAG